MTVTTNNTILQKGDGIFKEGEAAAVVSPGMLIQLDAELKVIPNNQAGKACQAAVAFEGELWDQGREFTVDYAIGNIVLYNVLRPGSEYQALADSVIVAGDLIASAGNGRVKKADTASDVAIGQARGAVTAAAATAGKAPGADAAARRAALVTVDVF